MISECSCHHHDQDSRYGTGRRVFNAMKKDDYFRCSVCGSERVVVSRKKEKALAAAKETAKKGN